METPYAEILADLQDEQDSVGRTYRITELYLRVCVPHMVGTITSHRFLMRPSVQAKKEHGVPVLEVRGFVDANSPLLPTTFVIASDKEDRPATWRYYAEQWCIYLTQDNPTKAGSAGHT